MKSPYYHPPVRVALTCIVIVSGMMASRVHAEPEGKALPTGKPGAVGSIVALPKLQDVDGRPIDAADASARCTVLFFLGTECPLVKLYASRVEQLVSELHADGVRLIGIASNTQDDVDELRAFAKENRLTFPIVKDATCQLADLVSATRTPEVVMLDQTFRVRYRGRIDGQFTFGSGVGLAAPVAKRSDLKLAIQQLLLGQEIEVPSTEVKGCLIGRPKQPSVTADVTYCNQMARLFQKRCVECHRAGQIGPFPLDSYDEAVGWAEMIEEVVHAGRMPPWHANPEHGRFANDARLSDEEKRWVREWVEAGCPKGDPAELPKAVEYPERWFMNQEPDHVVWMSEEPVPVKASGVEDYRYYVVDPGFKEDQWVRLAECLPGNRSVVHHIIVYIQSPEAKSSNIGEHELLVGYAPGTRPFVAPKGWARRIPAGSKLIFEMHYTPIGTEEQDRSCLGLVLVDPSEVTHQMWTTNAINMRFSIPPHAANHRVEADKVFKQDVQLLSLFPHMHIRGKAFRYELDYPDGRHEILLDIPQYDFNWQSSFVLDKPKLVPKGTRMRCTAWFDNSNKNLANPDPDATVGWGEQTWQEMMIGWHDVAVPVEVRLPENDAVRGASADTDRNEQTALVKE